MFFNSNDRRSRPIRAKYGNAQCIFLGTKGMFVQLHVPMLFANLKRRRTDSSESESETPPQGFAAQTSWLDSGPRPAAAGSLSTGLRLTMFRRLNSTRGPAGSPPPVGNNLAGNLPRNLRDAGVTQPETDLLFAASDWVIVK